MTVKYQINWKSKETKKEGHGDPVFESFEMAQETAKRLNSQTPYLDHWVTAVPQEENIEN